MDDQKELLIRIDERVAANQKKLSEIDEKLTKQYVTKETHDIEVVGIRRWLYLGTGAISSLAAWVFHLSSKG
jgi:hypothetical protein